MPKFLKNTAFLLLCLAVGFGAAKLFLYAKSKWRNHDFTNVSTTLVTGIGDAPAKRGFLLSIPPQGEALSTLLTSFHDQHATTVAVRYPTPGLPELVAAAHAKNLFVLLLPPASFAPQNPYPKPLSDIAAEAAAAGVDILCLSWLNTDPDMAYWNSEAQSARARFKGKLILATTYEQSAAVADWQYVDYIGVIDLPFARRLPSAANPSTVSDFRVTWAATLSTLESIAKGKEKKVALLTTQVPSNPTLKLSPPHTPAPRPPQNLTLQRTIYEALLIETKGRAQFTDILLLPYSDLQHLPELTPALINAWDPKKPRPPETFPAGIADPFEADPPADTQEMQ